MKLETFFEKFDQFADAPDAVAKMRELVLDLAATGRLLPRKGEWEACPLKTLATKIGSGATPAGGRESYFSKGIPLIRSMNVHFRGFDRTGLVFLSDEQADELSNVTVQTTDVLLNLTGASIGRVTIAPDEMAGARVNQHVTIIRPTQELFPRFLSMFLASPSVQRMIDEIQVDLKRWAVAKEEERQDVPSSWTWIRFAGVGEQRLGKMLDAQKNRGESKPYLRNTNAQWMRFELDDVKEMRVEEREKDELRLKLGDLLICEGGEPGRCAIWRDAVPEMYFQKALHRVRPCDAILSEFLALNLQIDCRNEVLAGYFTGATIKHLTGRSLSAYPIPIPPLAEQRRIVAKVEQLMALVDALETQLAASGATAENLVTAIVSELTQPT